MKTDLLLVPMNARWADLRAAALAAEEAGFDGLWTWDHLRDPDGGGGPGVPDAWTVLTALAELTQRVMLGPLVLKRRQPSPRRARQHGGDAPDDLEREAAPRPGRRGQPPDALCGRAGRDRAGGRA
jgi:hypothetical protein